MTDDPILRAHLAQMAQSVSPIYDLVARLPDPEAQREAGGLADLVAAEGLNAPRSLPQHAAELHALRQAVANARPDRKCMQFLLDSFESWIAALSSEARAPFLETIPELAPAAAELGERGMARLIETAHSEPSLLEGVARVSMTTPDAVRAVAAIAHRAAKHHRPELLQRLVELFPPDRMEESRDAERLPAAIGAATEAVAAASEEAWPAAMQLALALTARNVSSACGALNALPAALRRVPVASLRFYLEDYALLVGHVGAAVSGVCLKELPGWLAAHGNERTRTFVSAACAAARAWGETAGQCFLERRTKASREMLG